MVSLLWLLACGGEKVEPEGEAPMPELEPAALLTRASLDLRGVRPSVQELEQVLASPSELDALVDGFVEDERFEGRIRDLYAEIYLTRADYFYVDGADYGLDSAAFASAVGQEPLRVVGRVAAQDLPWTEIVLADWTMASEELAAAWPLEREEGEGWQLARYTDERPAAGVLSTNGLWWRYLTTDSNANRGRANALARILLCEDYLSRPIAFDRNVNLLDGEAVATALKTNPACVNCHVTLDPLASYLFGFMSNAYDPVDAAHYHPERERLYRNDYYTDVEPAYYGEPGYGLEDLAGQIAADPRFPNCAVEQVYGLLLRRPLSLEDSDALTLHREAFLKGDLRMKALVRSVLADPAWRSGPSDNPRAVPRKMVTAELMASQIEDLTGFRWAYGGYDMLGTDLVGLRTLAGGSDGLTVTRTATSPNTTVFLVQERLAELAAAHVVAADAALPAPERRLFIATRPDQDDPPGRARQLQHLHLRLFGRQVDLDGEEVLAGMELWQLLYDIDRDAMGAWTGTLSALLRDPDLLFY